MIEENKTKANGNGMIWCVIAFITIALLIAEWDNLEQTGGYILITPIALRLWMARWNLDNK